MRRQKNKNPVSSKFYIASVYAIQGQLKLF